MIEVMEYILNARRSMSNVFGIQRNPFGGGPVGGCPRRRSISTKAQQLTGVFMVKFRLKRKKRNKKARQSRRVNSMHGRR